jgi:prefoldin subunit 5
VDIATERQEYNAMLASLYEEIERLRAQVERLRTALQDAKDLAIGDAPAHMIIDVCGRALAVGIIEHDNP